MSVIEWSRDKEEDSDDRITCNNCKSSINLGNTFYTTPSGNSCSMDCVLELMNIQETVLEDCYFIED